MTTADPTRADAQPQMHNGLPMSRAEQIARKHKDLATVIERAVRERVAGEIELYADAMWDLIESPNAARLALEETARIARGATDD